MSVKQRLDKLLKRIDKPVRSQGSYHGTPHRILVGTHHKSGSVWMMNIFKAICAEYSLIYCSGEQKELPSQFDVFFQDHSEFELNRLGSPCRGVHLIRDPRDIIISGAFFHQHSTETWLHVPLPYLNGQTYQQALNRCETLKDERWFSGIKRKSISENKHGYPSTCSIILGLSNKRGIVLRKSRL